MAVETIEWLSGPEIYSNLLYSAYQIEITVKQEQLVYKCLQSASNDKNSELCIYRKKVSSLTGNCLKGL